MTQSTENRIKLNNALIEACKAADFDQIKKLVKSGVSPFARNGLPVCLACQSGDLDIVKYLLEKDIDRNTNTEYAKFRSKKAGHVHIIKFLEEYEQTLWPFN